MIPLRFLTLGPAAYLVGGTDAGDPMRAYYAVAGRVFSILSAQNPVILGDTPAGTFGLAWFYGLAGLDPRFAVRDDVVLNEKIAYHESTHAWEAILVQLLVLKYGWSEGQAYNWVRTAYWNWRGFSVHGSWQDALDYAMGLGASAGWAYLPGESIAEAGSAAISGTVISEWTMNWGRDLAIVNGVYSPQAGALNARIFFQSLQQEVEDMALTDAEVERIAQRVAAILNPQFNDVLVKLDSGFNTSVTEFINRQTAGDKDVRTEPIDR